MMKKLLFLGIVAVFASSVQAQNTYLYNQDFESYPAFSPPNNWTNTIPGMGVYTGRGFNASKGLDRNYNANSRRDSITSPFMGVVAPNTKLSFMYRVVDYIGNIGVKHFLDPGDEIVVYIVDSLSTTQIYRITTANHVDTSAFKEVVVDLTNFEGRTVKVRFSVTRGTSSLFDFNANFDNVAMYIPQVTTSIGELKEVTGLALSPNPATTETSLRFHLEKGGELVFRLTDMHGRVMQTLPKTYFGTGDNRIDFNIEGIPAGVYFVQLVGASGQKTLRMLVGN